MRLVLAICGYSGAGKTTLIERLLPRLGERGLRVGVLKHDAHRLDIDRPGKDTARIFDAGAAAVCAHDQTQHFLRVREAGPAPLGDMLVRLPQDLDLVLVEGHKGSPLPKIVLAHPEPRATIEGPEVIATLPWGEQRPEHAEAVVMSWLEHAWARRPLGFASFVGIGASGEGTDPETVARRLERLGGLGDRLLLVGDRSTPVRGGLACGLPAVPGVDGPLAGLLGLLRHDPERAWLCIAAGQHDLGSEHVRWLRAQRRPGCWAVLPRLDADRPEHLGAIYEPMLLPSIERAVARGLRAVHEVLEHAPVAHVVPPAELVAGWRHPSSS